MGTGLIILITIVLPNLIMISASSIYHLSIFSLQLSLPQQYQVQQCPEWQCQVQQFQVHQCQEQQCQEQQCQEQQCQEQQRQELQCQLQQCQLQQCFRQMAGQMIILGRLYYILYVNLVECFLLLILCRLEKSEYFYSWIVKSRRFIILCFNYLLLLTLCASQMLCLFFLTKTINVQTDRNAA